MDASENESYFVMKKPNNDKDGVVLFVFSSPWWDLKNIGKIEIQFAEDGFWVVPAPLWSMAPKDFKEKFTKIKR